jgi:general nucleoside transport system permease protein
MTEAVIARLRSGAIGLAIPLAAVVLAFATTALLLLAVGSDPVNAYSNMLDAAFGDPFAISNTLLKSLPRLLAALGIALALRAGLWNIGAEGQIYIGAIAATAAYLWLPDAGALITVVALLAGALAGALWAAGPGLLRATRNVSEVISTLMLVYIAMLLANYLLQGPWSISGATFPASDPVPSSERLPIIWDDTLLNAGIFAGLIGAFLLWLIVDRMPFGVRLRAVGSSPRGAAFAGVNVKRTIVVAMALSGAAAGIAGAIEVLGARGRLIEGFSPGYGFEAIAIALLGRLRPVGIVAAALLFGALDAGAAGLQTGAAEVPSSISQVTAGLAVVYVLIALGGREILERRRRARRALERAEGVMPTGPKAASTEASA